MYSELQSTWKDSGIMIDVKLQLQMTIVFPVLLYAAETWTVNKEDEKDYLHLRWAVTDVFFGSEMARSKNQWRDTSSCTTERNIGGYNPNEEVPTVSAYLQDARWSTVRHYCLEWSRVSVVQDDLHEDRLMTFFEVVCQRSERCIINDRRQN